MSEKIRSVLLILMFVSAGTVLSIRAQAPLKTAGAEVRASAAYAELLFQRTAVQSEMEGLAVEYTDDHPKVAEGRAALEIFDRERARLLAVKPAEAGKLTLALGKLIVRKAELELELWGLRKSLQEAHPDVKRARRRVEIYEAAIKEILG